MSNSHEHPHKSPHQPITTEDTYASALFLSRSLVLVHPAANRLIIILPGETSGDKQTAPARISPAIKSHVQRLRAVRSLRFAAWRPYRGQPPKSRSEARGQGTPPEAGTRRQLAAAGAIQVVSPIASSFTSCGFNMPGICASRCRSACSHIPRVTTHTEIFSDSSTVNWKPQCPRQCQ
jgi:hypothetical protein